MPTTGITVTKMAPALVGPSEPTPPGHLPLSYLDHLPAVRFMCPMIHVLHYGHEPAKVIREALAKALVPYYPVAGRVQETEDDGRLRVSCTGEGVWFVEATASCSLADIKYLEDLPLEIPKEELLPSPPHGTNLSALTFILQVTNFKCGGFTIGVLFNHVLFDGIGVAQFMTAIGDIARGLDQPAVTPIWCREAIPSPPILPREVHSSKQATSTPSNLEFLIADFSLDSVNSIKNQFAKDTGDICSSFDVVSAILWRSRTRAIGLRADAGVSLIMAANIREVLHMESGYYGNCIYCHIATATSAQIVEASVVDVVRIIRESKEDLSTKTLSWLKGERSDMLDNDLLTVTDWRRIGFSETDYGWGTPNHVLPLVDLGLAGGFFLRNQQSKGDLGFAAGYLLNPPAPRKGVRLLTCCVEKQHANAFSDELGSYV